METANYSILVLYRDSGRENGNDLLLTKADHVEALDGAVKTGMASQPDRVLGFRG